MKRQKKKEEVRKTLRDKNLVVSSLQSNKIDITCNKHKVCQNSCQSKCKFLIYFVIYKFSAILDLGTLVQVFVWALQMIKIRIDV